MPSTYLHDGEGDVLTVYFHGATDRTKFTMPRYERLRSMPKLGLGPVMFFSDPCPWNSDSRMMLSWYVGTEDVDLHREIARMIDAYARRRGIEKVLLVGNSGWRLRRAPARRLPRTGPPGWSLVQPADPDRSD